jgi:2-hydroxyglutarate dehydrogenase
MFSPRLKPTLTTLLRHPSTRSFSSSLSHRADFTHAVVGGGAVGLAIARRLQQREGASTVLIEKHKIVGSETSSRNSEVSYCEERRWADGEMGGETEIGGWE